MTTPINWTDPCARAAALRSAYYEIVQGGQEVQIRTRTLDAEDFVAYAPANLSVLQAELRVAESECAATTGATNPNQRRAIGFRSKRGY